MLAASIATVETMHLDPNTFSSLNGNSTTSTSSSSQNPISTTITTAIKSTASSSLSSTISFATSSSSTGTQSSTTTTFSTTTLSPFTTTTTTTLDQPPPSLTGYVIMFQCVSGCVQNLTNFLFKSTNVQMAWGIDQTSQGGGYNGGFAYNPQCFTCDAYTNNSYEYPWFNYQTYTSEPLGVYSSVPYVYVNSAQFEAAYPGVGNHLFIAIRYPLTIQVTPYAVVILQSSGIFTSVPQGRPLKSTFITISPRANSCGGFDTHQNMTC